MGGQSEWDQVNSLLITHGTEGKFGERRIIRLSLLVRFLWQHHHERKLPTFLMTGATAIKKR